DQPKGVDTVSESKRRRRIEELAADAKLERPATQGDPITLETIVLQAARPNIRVRNGAFAIPHERWSHLETQRAVLERAASAVGRIQLGDGTVLGSATCVGDGLFMTTRTVVDRFSVGVGRDVPLIDGRNPMLDMRAEGMAPQDARSVTRVVLAHP